MVLIMRCTAQSRTRDILKRSCNLNTHMYYYALAHLSMNHIAQASCECILNYSLTSFQGCPTVWSNHSKGFQSFWEEGMNFSQFLDLLYNAHG